MQRRLEKLVIDVDGAAARIATFVGAMDHDTFVLDAVVKSAVQMQFVTTQAQRA